MLAPSHISKTVLPDDEDGLGSIWITEATVPDLNEWSVEARAALLSQEVSYLKNFAPRTDQNHIAVPPLSAVLSRPEEILTFLAFEQPPGSNVDPLLTTNATYLDPDLQGYFASADFARLEHELNGHGMLEFDAEVRNLRSLPNNEGWITAAKLAAVALLDVVVGGLLSVRESLVTNYMPHDDTAG
ncbi:hypothetical protein BC936DRAFT_146165 [Jimgerdemannia flammicorona]|uniref:Uncharacterized protein n=1 Tax=Jimgerdemannia flammicorona TaxID=994334 RepID=A0A433DNZ3_9FUNG|nr:hypothetical protein BC936DRAFT_146165 [Jimgerdemannia flammicorona]